MAGTDSQITTIISNIKAFYNDESNKTTKAILLIVAGSLVTYAAYTYAKTNTNTEKSDAQKQQEEISNPTDINTFDKEESKEDIERKKAAKLAAKKKKKEVQKIINDLCSGTMLIVDEKGWNIKYFMNYYNMKKFSDALFKFQCKSCKNICRECVEIEEDDKEEEEDPIVMCEVCAIAENKKYTPYKLFRKMILKENIILPDPQEQDAIKHTMDTDIEVLKEDSAKQTIFTTKIFMGSLSKCINRKIPQIAEEEYEKQLKAQEFAEIKLENGVKKDLDWKFHDDSNTKQPLFYVSDDGLTATSNKRSGTILFGPFIAALQYNNKKWENDYRFAGNYYVIELKIHEADGCGVGFCQRDFSQYIGKNEGQVKCLMLNQTGWFYTSRTFKHEWQHSRESPMGKWFKSEDVIVMVIDCTEPTNVKGEIYNKEKPDNKFEIEKLPKQICFAVNIIVGSNPTGTIQPGVSIVSASVERRL